MFQREGDGPEVFADLGQAPFELLGALPPPVSIPNRNYMNLLELPMLFYVVCIVLYVTAGASATTIALAWAFVVLRVAHSLIHLTYNRVVHRLSAFAASNVALVVLWPSLGAVYMPVALLSSVEPASRTVTVTL